MHLPEPLSGASATSRRASGPGFPLHGPGRAMNDVIDQYHATRIEFFGDGIFTVFGAPVYTADHAITAVRCVIAMQKALHNLDKGWQQQGLARLWQRTGVMTITARIGIHCVPVVVGNLGNQRRMKYSVIGDTVNIAARLEALNKQVATDILVSQDVDVQLPEVISFSMVQHAGWRLRSFCGLARKPSVGQRAGWLSFLGLRPWL